MATAEPPFEATLFLSKVGEDRSLASYRPGELVFVQGDRADSLFYVQSGKVKLSVVSSRGKEAAISIAGAGDFFGEGCLAGQAKRVASAVVMADCSVLKIQKARAAEVLRDEPAFASLFNHYLLAHNAKMEEDLVIQKFNSTRKRLARELLRWANYGLEDRPEPVIAPLSQQTLADLINCSRQKVNALMNEFRDRGYIQYDGSSSLEVNDSLLNVVLED